MEEQQVQQTQSTTQAQPETPAASAPTPKQEYDSISAGYYAEKPGASQKKQTEPVVNNGAADQNKPDGKPAEAKANAGNPVPPKETRSDRNWGKMTRLNSDLKTKVDELNKRIAEYETKYGKELDTSALPDREAAKAEALHAVEKDRDARAIQEQQNEIQAQNARYYQALVEDQIPENERDEFVQNYNTIREHLSQNEPEMVEIFTSSKFGPTILQGAMKTIFADKAMFENWSSLSSHAKRQFLSNMELQIIRGGNVQPRQQQPQQNQEKPAFKPTIAAPGGPIPSGPTSARDEYNAISKNYYN